MKHINLYDNYLTKKYQRKKNYDEYLYNNGFGDRYYICSNCGSHRLRPIPKGGMTPPDWICDDCGEKNYAPKWVDPKEYWLEKNVHKYNL